MLYPEGLYPGLHGYTLSSHRSAYSLRIAARAPDRHCSYLVAKRVAEHAAVILCTGFIMREAHAAADIKTIG